MRNKTMWIIVIAVALIFLLALPVILLIGRIFPAGPYGMMQGPDMMDNWGIFGPVTRLGLLLVVLFGGGLLSLLVIAAVVGVILLMRRNGSLGNPLAPNPPPGSEPLPPTGSEPYGYAPPIQTDTGESVYHGSSASPVTDDPLRTARDFDEDTPTHTEEMLSSIEEQHTPSTLEQQAPCASCGKPVQPDWNTCPYCGHKLR